MSTHLPSASACLLGGLFAAAMFVASPAAAFQLVPITQEFEPSGRGANQTFQVENSRDEQVTVTIAMAARKVDVNGQETLQDTEDFSIFPTEIILQPKTARVVRVKWVGDPNPKSELAYRIIAEETPLKLKRETPGASVFLTIRYIGSIYVVPKGAKPDVTVASAKAIQGPQGAQLELMLENKGLRHAILDEPLLTLTSDSVSKTLDNAAVGGALEGENILAQGTRRIVLPWPNGLPAGQVKANLKYSLQ